jgi:hypothetical protein
MLETVMQGAVLLGPTEYPSSPQDMSKSDTQLLGKHKVGMVGGVHVQHWTREDCHVGKLGGVNSIRITRPVYETKSNLKKLQKYVH